MSDWEREATATVRVMLIADVLFFFVRMVSHMVGEWEIHDGSRHVQDPEHEDGTNSELAGCCELEFPE